METIGHFTHLQERQAALLAFSRSRGMSECALAMLPQPPSPRRGPEEARPYIATARDAMLARPPLAPGVRRDKLSRRLGPVTDADRERIAIILEAVGRAYGVEPDYIRGGSGPRCKARHHAIYIVRAATRRAWARLSPHLAHGNAETLKRAEYTFARAIRSSSPQQAKDAAIRAEIPAEWFVS